MGSYYYGDKKPQQQERDRKKRLVCEEKNVLLLKIWEDWDKTTWLQKIIEQIKEQTGVELTPDKLIEFKNYLGQK